MNLPNVQLNKRVLNKGGMGFETAGRFTKAD